MRCDSEEAWSAVCLHSESVLSCIDLTASLCQFSGLPSSGTKLPNVLVINQIFQAVPPVTKL